MQKPILVLLTLTVSLGILIAAGCNTTGELQVEAQVIYKLGGPQPVARETLYLLSRSVDSYEMKEAYRSYVAATLAQRIPQEEMKERITRVYFLLGEGKAIWSRYIVLSVQTDFKGQATFQNVKPGDYWVFGMTETRAGGRLLWDVKTTVKPGQNRLALSNDNSEEL